MGFDLNVTIPMLSVFIQGIFSFFSPCVLPIIPLYMGYLSGGTATVGEDGAVRYDQKTILINTVFFILGVSFAFGLLAIGVSALGQFFTQNQMVFARVGGIVVILLGLMQLGVFEKPFGGRDWRLPVGLNILRMNPITALVMGFTFSFAWTPCVGPALSTVLIMVSSASTSGQGLLLMGVYTLGFTLPFLAVGLFTSKALDLLKKHGKVVAYTVKIGAVVMIFMGVMLFTGTMNGITGYLSTFGGTVTTEEPVTEQTTTEEAAPEVEETADATQTTAVPAPDFTLQDQYGNTHTLSEYEGKVVFLNFWATWCGPCQSEMPEVEALYQAYGYNEEDVVVLGVALPNDENRYTQEGSVAYVSQYLTDNGYTFPTVMDMTGEVLSNYGISAFPTTFMIDAEGNVYGYISGALTYDIMESIVAQTMAG